MLQLLLVIPMLWNHPALVTEEPILPFLDDSASCQTLVASTGAVISTETEANQANCGSCWNQGVLKGKYVGGSCQTCPVDQQF